MCLHRPVTLEDRDHDPAAAENWLKYARLMRASSFETEWDDDNML